MAPPRPPHSALRRLVLDEGDDPYLCCDVTGAVPVSTWNKQDRGSEVCVGGRGRGPLQTGADSSNVSTSGRYSDCGGVEPGSSVIARGSQPSSTFVSREAGASNEEHDIRRDLAVEGTSYRHGIDDVCGKVPEVSEGALCGKGDGVYLEQVIVAGPASPASRDATTFSLGDTGVAAVGLHGGTKGVDDAEAALRPADSRNLCTQSRYPCCSDGIAASAEATGPLERSVSGAVTGEPVRSEAVSRLCALERRTFAGGKEESVSRLNSGDYRGLSSSCSQPFSRLWPEHSPAVRRVRELPLPPQGRVSSDCTRKTQVSRGSDSFSGGHGATPNSRSWEKAEDCPLTCRNADKGRTVLADSSERACPAVRESHALRTGLKQVLARGPRVVEKSVSEEEGLKKVRSRTPLLPAFDEGGGLVRCLVDDKKSDGGDLSCTGVSGTATSPASKYLRRLKQSPLSLPLPPAVQPELRPRETSHIRLPTCGQGLGGRCRSPVYSGGPDTAGASEKGDASVGSSRATPSSHCQGGASRSPSETRREAPLSVADTAQQEECTVSVRSCSHTRVSRAPSQVLPPHPCPRLHCLPSCVSCPPRSRVAALPSPLTSLTHLLQERRNCSPSSEETGGGGSASRPQPPPARSAEQSLRACGASVTGPAEARDGERRRSSLWPVPPAPRKIASSPAENPCLTHRLWRSGGQQHGVGACGATRKWCEETTARQQSTAMQRGKGGRGTGGGERRGDGSRSGSAARSSLGASLFDLNAGIPRRPLVSFVEPVAPPAGPRPRPSSGASGDFGTGSSRVSTVACSTQTATGWRAAVDSVMTEVQQMRDASGTAVFRDVVRIQSVVGESVEIIPAASVDSHRRVSGSRSQVVTTSGVQQRRCGLSEASRRPSERDDDLFFLSSFGRRGSSGLLGAGSSSGGFSSSRRAGMELDDSRDSDRPRNRRGREPFVCASSSSTPSLPAVSRSVDTGPADSDAEDIVFQMWLQQEAILENTFPLQQLLSGEEALERAMLASLAAMGGESLDSFLTMLQQPLLLLHQHGRWRNASLAVGPPNGGWARLWGFDGPVRVAGGVGSSAERRAPLTEAELTRNTRRWVFKKSEAEEKQPSGNGGKTLPQKYSHGDAGGVGYTRQDSSASNRECGLSRASTRSSFSGEERKPAVQPGIAAQPPTPPTTRGSPAASTGLQGEQASRAKHSSSEKGRASLSSGENKNCCSICLADYQSGDEMITFRCMHIFHFTCVHDWLQHSGRRTCPLCLVPIKASEDKKGADAAGKAGEVGGEEESCSGGCSAKEE